MRQLPANATATDVIDLLTEEVMNLVKEVNRGRQLTNAQYAAAFGRAFAETLPRFLASLRAHRPELAEQLQRQFVAEEEARMNAEEPTEQIQVRRPRADWQQQLTEALQQLYGLDEARAVLRCEAAGALSTVLRQRCEETGQTANEVLARLDADDVAFALRADLPAAFLTNRIRQLT
uniref:hypothetical protein n=1 Tax=Amycolatopsis sp. CA-290885 TaxID=3239925 RepID=UPI003F497D69